MFARKVFFCSAHTRVVPYNFIAEIALAKNFVHDDFQVVTRRGVAMQINAAGVLQQAMHRGNPLRHVREIGKHAAAIGVDYVERTDGAMRRVGDRAHDQINAVLRLFIPFPSVGERGQLREIVLVPAISLRAEKNIVVGLAVERRVQVNQVHAMVVPVAHHFQAIAVVKRVCFHARGFSILTALTDTARPAGARRRFHFHTGRRQKACGREFAVA